MIVAFLKSIRSRRAAARNLRDLSALDDAALHDIGLDRRTLRAFCEKGCAHAPAPSSRPEPRRAGAMPRGLGIAFR